MRHLPGMLLLVASALAGSVDGMAAVDVLTASSINEGPGAGPSDRLGHTDLGLRLRMRVRELDDKLTFHLDYRGREALTGGDFRNQTLRLLYRGEAQYALSDVLTVGAGRFIPSTPTFTPVDGLRLRATRKTWWAEIHAGRRAISTARRNLGGVLPAFGAEGGLILDRLRIDASVAYSEDEHRIGEEITNTVGGATGQIRADVTPVDPVRVGGQVAFTQGQTYAIGPTWAEATVEAQALGLFQGMGWVTVEPADPVRLDLDVIHQNAQNWAVGLLGEDTSAIVRPRFTDVRFRARLGPPRIGWIRPMVRYRVRPDRTELRLQARIDVHDLGVPWLYVRTMAAFDDIRGEGQAQDVGSRDRAFGMASIGVREKGFDGSIGASYVQRGAKPVSSRLSNATTSDDLMPFVLEADPIVSARAFYSARRWFAGVDLEKHLTEPEVRAFVQIGALADVGW
jgi:hypothetical protein